MNLNYILNLDIWKNKMISFKQFLIENQYRDIVVTVPKSEYKNDDLETKHMADHNETQFWTMKRIPKDIGIGSKIYFCKNGKIESFMTIFKIEKDKEETCTTTGRCWKGNLIHFKDLQYLKEPIVGKGFQGFRYTWF